MKTITINLSSLGLVLSVALLGGCAGEPTVSEQNFGESVRQMVRAQTSDPSTLSNPSTESVESTDGQLLEGALDAYRSSVADRATAGNEVLISVEGGQR